MSLSVTQTKTALGVNLTASFQGAGGTAPYTFSVLSGGAGGSIDSASGIYIAPSVVSSVPSQLFDTIQVTDNVGATITSQIMVGTPLLLFCDVIQQYLGLAPGRVNLWDQKLPEPTDSGMFVAISVLSCKPFGNTNRLDSSGNSVQSVNMYAQMQIDVISRGPEARDRKEDVILALFSNYSQAQQEANSFFIGKLPPGSQFVNLSSPDGAGIPYRFNIAVSMQYFYTKTKAVSYFDTFATPQVNTNS